MKSVGFLSRLACSVILSILFSCTAVTRQSYSPQYYHPLAGASYVSTGETIAVRYGPELSAGHLANLEFEVRGSKSGLHAGQTILADDHRTVIFKPAHPFAAGERVRVRVGGLHWDAQTRYAPLSYTFTVAVDQQPGEAGSTDENLPTESPRTAFPGFLTVPRDIPHYTVTSASPNGDGYIFVAPFYWTKSTVGSYLLILDDQGQLVYYRSVADDLSGFDFKVQPNGLLSFFGLKDSTVYLMDQHYQIVDRYQAGNGYTADLHDFQLLPNGNALLMGYDAETVDMSNFVEGGKKNATVTGLIIQELDPSKNVIFEWRSWDHFAFSDSTSVLTADQIDLVHGNALALSNDGNLLLSSRNQSEITKIDLQTADVLWRLGGKANMFKFVNGKPFAYQHDVRQLPNGNITLFDNQGTAKHPAASRGLEYQIDEVGKTATEVWSSTGSASIFAMFMGNMQRLSNGNSFLSWGAPSISTDFEYISMMEMTPRDEVVFQLSFDKPYVSYRAFRFPWQGFPQTKPDLAFQIKWNKLTLGYSWNGATEVTSYRVFGGRSPQSLRLIEDRPRIYFETQSHFDLKSWPEHECYFQVAAMNKDGKEMARSNVISTDARVCPIAQPAYLSARR